MPSQHVLIRSWAFREGWLSAGGALAHTVTVSPSISSRRSAMERGGSSRLCLERTQGARAETTRTSGLQKKSMRAAATADIKQRSCTRPTKTWKDATGGHILKVNPPRLFQDAGATAPGEQWIVQRTLYGTHCSKKSWGAYRDRIWPRWGD